MSNISFLIGAGFSIPLGYPSANTLTGHLLNMRPDTFSIQSDGTMYALKPDEQDSLGNGGNFINKYFFCETMHYYDTRFSGFNYEDYYDFLANNEGNTGRDEDFQKFVLDFISRHKVKENPDGISVNLIHTALRTLNQAVAGFIVDRNGHQFYEKVHLGMRTVPEHHNIMNCIRMLGEHHQVHIHSLNHDMVFERYKSSDYLNGYLADGFEELGSPYYYEMGGAMLSGRKLRISQFTNNYNERFNLYKLHSSVDYYPFYKQDDQGLFLPDTFVKTDMAIRPDRLFKEVNNNGTLEYFNCWVNYKPDFLSGTTSKILRYKDTVYFDKVFKNFEANLQSAEMLVVVGYGCNDSEVNNIIYKNFRLGEKPIYISAVNITPAIDAFIKSTGATLISKYVQDIVSADIGY